MTSLTGPERLPADGTKADSVVVLLHGLGADGADLIGLAPDFARLLPRTAFLSPDAPDPCDMAPYGRQWFSLLDRTPEVVADLVAAASPVVEGYLASVLKRFDVTPDRLALVGFSQGTIMSLQVAYRLPHELAGVVGFSGGLAGSDMLGKEVTARPPALLVHGEADDVVVFDRMLAAAEALRAVRVDVQTLARPGLGHGIDEAGIRAAGNFLLERLG
ncbi:prolyl oligopeptidase family serine peptidase [Alphaproteobacteria bacterium HT1-32]|nr:prolyl oligopeptidase family serine peptidase [Alphaproteobacteria bacterium HT1-32]